MTLVPNEQETYKTARRVLWGYILAVGAVALALGILHLLYGGLKRGGVYWFNLDKERNLPTWFSGALFLSFGCSAFAGWYFEEKRNTKGDIAFPLTFLWIPVGVAGLLMSLDEITILHENLFWREVRRASEKLGDQWVHLTQWQILFAPVLILGFIYFALFLPTASLETGAPGFQLSLALPVGFAPWHLKAYGRH